jgi:hypothetical protein
MQYNNKIGCVDGNVRVCVPMSMCTCIPMSLWTFVPMYLCNYTCVPMYMCTSCVPIYLCTYVWVTCKSWPSARRRPHTIHSTVQFNRLFKSSIWYPLSKIKTNSVQPTQTVTSAHGPNVSQFNFCTGGGQREEKRLAVDRFLRGIWALHVPVRCVWWAGAAVAFYSPLLSAM